MQKKQTWLLISLLLILCLTGGAAAEAAQETSEEWIARFMVNRESCKLGALEVTQEPFVDEQTGTLTLLQAQYADGAVQLDLIGDEKGGMDRIGLFFFGSQCTDQAMVDLCLRCFGKTAVLTMVTVSGGDLREEFDGCKAALLPGLLACQQSEEEEATYTVVWAGKEYEVAYMRDQGVWALTYQFPKRE